MKKKWFYFSIILLFMAGLTGCGMLSQRASSTNTASSKTAAQTSRKAETPYLQSTTPTFYVHGFHGSARSTNTLISYAEKQTGAQKVLVATVASNGQLTFSGEWSKNIMNPIIQVVFSNNVAVYDSQSAWLQAVISELATKYGFTQYNVVAHSAGNVATVNMLMTADKPANFPKIAKFVSIAGCYDGVITVDDVANQNYFTSGGAPAYKHAAYVLLDGKRQNFPNGVHILNMIGDLNDGSHSDGLVSNVSARSLKYLIRGHQADYTEKVFSGSNAQHSKLHENSQVATAVDQYLWGNPNYQQAKK